MGTEPLMTSTLSAIAVIALLPLQAGALGRGESVTVEAERLARKAVERAPTDPAAGLAWARRALGLTVDFEPTAFVTPGRKGEVVEDAFQEARAAYKRHRAVLYEALGTVLAGRQGAALAASRYLRRALLLDPTPGRALALAQALNDLGRGREALDAVCRGLPGLATLPPEATAVIERAADVARLPSAQAEIDRVRLQSLLGVRVTLRDGPLETPPGTRLSTAPVVRLEEGPLTVVYAAERSCATCSEDLEGLARLVPKAVRVLALPAGDDQDQALRQVIGLYKLGWAVLLGSGVAGRLSLAPRSALLIARGGWTLAEVRAPFGPELAAALAVLQKADLQETVPRPAWNRQPVDRRPPAPPPALLPDGLAPGEDEPFPPQWSAAVLAFRGGRVAQAQTQLDALEAEGDGWLLPPEARLDRALCLAASGRRDAARRLLLRTGDSRFEDAIDRLLEKVSATR